MDMGRTLHDRSQSMAVHMRDEYTTVRMSDKIRTDARIITFLVAGTMNIADLKARPSSMLRIPVASMVLLNDDDEDEMPDWTSLTLTVAGGGATVKLVVVVPTRDVTFHLQIQPSMQRSELQIKLSSILATPRHDMRVLNARGIGWRTCATCSLCAPN